MKLIAIFFLTFVLLSGAAVAAEPQPSLDKLVEQAEAGDIPAYKALLKRAETGDAAAQVSVGDMYTRGRWEGDAPHSARRRPDFDGAMRWYQYAARGGSAAGMFAIGELYEHGQGVVKDQGTATVWYDKARTKAQEGKAAAQFELGWRYELGLPPLQRDPAAALTWLKKSAAQDYPAAETALGEAYENGWDGLKQDYAAAMAWFQKAAARENVEAQYDIGVLYANGLGVAKDSAMADKWNKLAVDNGFQTRFITTPQGTVTIPQPVGNGKP